MCRNTGLGESDDMVDEVPNDCHLSRSVSRGLTRTIPTCVDLCAEREDKLRIMLLFSTVERNWFLAPKVSCEFPGCTLT
jgi:hypothetical protein